MGNARGSHSEHTGTALGSPFQHANLRPAPPPPGPLSKVRDTKGRDTPQLRDHMHVTTADACGSGADLMSLVGRIAATTVLTAGRAAPSPRPPSPTPSPRPACATSATACPRRSNRTRPGPGTPASTRPAPPMRTRAPASVPACPSRRSHHLGHSPPRDGWIGTAGGHLPPKPRHASVAGDIICGTHRGRPARRAPAVKGLGANAEGEPGSPRGRQMTALLVHA